MEDKESKYEIMTNTVITAVKEEDEGLDNLEISYFPDHCIRVSTGGVGVIVSYDDIDKFIAALGLAKKIFNVEGE